MTVTSQNVSDALSPLGRLNLATLALEASAAIGATITGPEGRPISREPIGRLADVLPRLMSTDSFAQVVPEQVDTAPLIALGAAIRRTSINLLLRSSVKDYAEILGKVQADLRVVANDGAIDEVRMRDLQAFCTGLAGALSDQVRIPSLSGDAKRV